jgi:hypothetical protein
MEPRPLAVAVAPVGLGLGFGFGEERYMGGHMGGIFEVMEGEA